MEFCEWKKIVITKNPIKKVTRDVPMVNLSTSHVQLERSVQNKLWSVLYVKDLKSGVVSLVSIWEEKLGNSFREFVHFNGSLVVFS